MVQRNLHTIGLSERLQQCVLTLLLNCYIPLKCKMAMIGFEVDKLVTLGLVKIHPEAVQHSTQQRAVYVDDEKSCTVMVQGCMSQYHTFLSTVATITLS